MRRISFEWPKGDLDPTTIYCTSDFSPQARNLDTSKWFFHFSHDQERQRILPVPLSLLREYFRDESLIALYAQKASLNVDADYQAFFDFFNQKLCYLREIEQLSFWSGRLTNNDLLGAQQDFFHSSKTKQVLNAVRITSPHITQKPVHSVVAFLSLQADARIFDKYVATSEFAFFCYVNSGEDKKELHITCARDGQYIDQLMDVPLKHSQVIDKDVSDEGVKETLTVTLSAIIQQLEKAAGSYCQKIVSEFQENLAATYKASKKDADRQVIFAILDTYSAYLRERSFACISALSSNVSSYSKSNQSLRGELDRTKRVNVTLNTTISAMRGSVSGIFSRKKDGSAAAEPKPLSQQTFFQAVEVVLAPVPYEVFKFLYGQSRDNAEELEKIYQLIVDIFKASCDPDYPQKLRQRLSDYVQQYAAVEPKLSQGISAILSRYPQIDVAYEKPARVETLHCLQVLKSVCDKLDKKVKLGIETRIFKDAVTFFEEEIRSLNPLLSKHL